jgi:hypothetical protein
LVSIDRGHYCMAEKRRTGKSTVIALWKTRKAAGSQKSFVKRSLKELVCVESLRGFKSFQSVASRVDSWNCYICALREGKAKAQIFQRRWSLRWWLAISGMGQLHLDALPVLMRPNSETGGNKSKGRTAAGSGAG